MHFKVAAVFSDNMVLQQGKKVCIFGEAGDGIRVNVSYLGYNAEGVSAGIHGESKKAWHTGCRLRPFSI